MKVRKQVTVMVVGLLMAGCLIQSAKAQTAKQWFDKGEWLNGLKLTPHESINKEEFAKQYEANKAYWDKAFAYLKETDLNSLKPGKYPLIGDDVFVTVTDGPTKNLEAASWECHKNYADIQHVISGQEDIGVAPFASATVKVAYDPAKEVGFYNVEGGKFYVADPQNFFIFFPEVDVHRPSVKRKGFDTVKKIVIKVRINK